MTNRYRYMKNMKAGFSVLEIALVIAIGIIVLGMVIAYYNTASVLEKSEECVRETKIIQEAVHSMGAGQQNWSWLGSYGSPLVAQSGMIPAKYVKNVVNGNFSQATGLVSPFGGDVQVAQGHAVSGYLSYYISFFNLPAKACQNLALETFHGKAYYTIVNGTYYQSGQLTGAQVVQFCNNGTSNNVAWDFL